ncbi:rRNA processing protein-like protein Utp6 [Westerdykella ornata]|uniref:rRNA processing protein-like protein Utp6 n=1 Tax=Westerdykella ornata TaxID=318751 RepID=A0A6A6JRH0_WESOR|nr:rRNA processing protein-like protein Utp6 [Westerdykella ornata]KAF2278468.1 rRNA processing protein-like protein Utp6 [Westerdykella ornata]
MAGASDKARFYLENSLGELSELERKKIFTKDEIVSIARKRSDFEHIINARGSNPSDYVRYIEFEKNVDALRRKRIERLGVKSNGTGSRTVFFLYNRAIRKFPGDLDIWMQYIEFARKEKAFKKLNEIFTKVVRLHPTKPGLWIYAARYFMEDQADITNARSYMQRALRFNKSSEAIWLEYAKLETIYIAKIAGRRKILGLDDEHATQATEQEDGDMIALPSVTAEDINPSVGKEEGADEVALQNLAAAPVLTGAIPIAVFDAAMKQFRDDPKVAERFFTMLAEFEQLPCLERILNHILRRLQETAPRTASTIKCGVMLHLLRAHPTSPEFPAALRTSLSMLDSAIQADSRMAGELAEFAIRQLISPLRTVEEADEQALKKALAASIRKYSRQLEDATSATTGDAIAKVVESLSREGGKADAKRLLELCVKQYGANEQLQLLLKSLGT